MKTFTTVLYHYLKCQPETPLACQEWRAEQAEESAQIVSYAEALHTDVAQLLRSAAAAFTPDADETHLLLDLADVVLTHINFGRIARTLLKENAAEQAGYSASLPSLLPSIN